MGKMKLESYVKLTFLSLSLFLLIACTSEEASKNKTEEPTKESHTENKNENQTSLKEKIINPPTSTDELIKYPGGKYAGKTVDLLPVDEKAEVYKSLDKMPPLNNDASEKEKELYWNNILYMFHEDFIDPQTVLEKWKMESFGSPEIKDPRFKFKENLNVEIVLDASGSMNGKIGGKTKMDLAKESITEFASSLPEEANVALRVYGHKGTGSDNNKKLSCESSDVVYVMQNYEENNFEEALNQFNPSGWTPITLALNKAKEDMAKYNGDQNTNIIFLVSDGVNTCGGDPVNVAKDLAESNIQPIINVIGFDVDSEGQAQLKNIATASEGIYATVNNQEALRQQFESAKDIAEKWDSWKRDAINDLDSIRVDREFMTLAFSNDWGEKRDKQNANLISAADYLFYEKKKITKEMYNYLSDKRDEQKDLIDSSQEEVVSYLESINDKTYEEMKKSIEEEYKQK
ncbi:VWA domain-containing protein [Fictibacillus sp. 5RED26]|uniref:VWA domain-containing protein n=1 Tax=Fictibacillus sp. 5RED26 TaxID=2745876 RepID=UPI0018CE0A06|nr:VWA domain-containing protein [Fictibacillus sp. 5RED26]MBH0159034.1 VWA domain-containing protein [Fictibacillus sp. 5RED26]